MCFAHIHIEMNSQGELNGFAIHPPPAAEVVQIWHMLDRKWTTAIIGDKVFCVVIGSNGLHDGRYCMSAQTLFQ